MMAPEIMRLVKEAEEGGFDAAFPGMCFGEFFLQDARQAVKMPVVGPAESAMIVAQLVGRKFAVITNGDAFIPVIEENIRFHGWTGQAIASRPVRAWDTDVIQLMVDAYNGRPEQLVQEFDRLAVECVRDGADVVICGCNPYGAALSQVGYNTVADTGVPVVTALPSMIKIAEALVDLRRSVGLVKSEAVLGRYRSTPAEVLADLADHNIRSARRASEALVE
jgi:allantoin racemase